jgi:hypothetical protein
MINDTTSDAAQSIAVTKIGICRGLSPAPFIQAATYTFV